MCSIVVIDTNKKNEFLSTLQNMQNHNNKGVEYQQENTINARVSNDRFIDAKVNAIEYNLENA